MSRRYFVRPGDVEPYSPANHRGTVNRRLIGRETVGARNLEVLHGTIEPGSGALPHAHRGIEQVCYVLDGRAVAEVDGQRQELVPGDCCFFPADVPHVLTAVGTTPLRLLVVYSPPYEEDPARALRSGGAA